MESVETWTSAVTNFTQQSLLSLSITASIFNKGKERKVRKPSVSDGEATQPMEPHSVPGGGFLSWLRRCSHWGQGFRLQDP